MRRTRKELGHDAAVRDGKPVPTLSSAAAERLLAYDWPGNVRELRNCMERIVALAPTERIDTSDLPPKVRDYRPGHVLVAADHPDELQPLEEVERRYILRVVDACKGNKSRAARVLGIGRKTLYRRLIGFGVSVSENDG